MYEEGNKKLSFNWVSLALKLVGLALLVFILCWFFTRNATKSNKTVKTDTDYINNITSMKEAAFEYFTETNLPETVGNTEKLTLDQMINQKLLIDFTDNGDKCDTSNSYIQATKTADGDYALKVSLDCEEKKDYIVTTIEKKDCTVVNCNNTSTANNSNKSSSDNTTSTNTGTNSSNKTSNSSTSSSSSKSSTSTTSNKSYNSSGTPSTSNKVSSTVTTTTTVTSTVKVTIACTTCNSKPVEKKEEKKTTYYKYYKYSDWASGYSYATDAENKKVSATTYNYCKPTTKTIYTTSYTSSSNVNYCYTLQFKNFTAEEVNSVAIVNNSESYFSNSLVDYQAYRDTRDQEIAMVNANPKQNSYAASVNEFKNSSLTNSNFSFTVSNVYKSGNYYYTNIRINVANTTGISSFYDSGLKKSIYYVPLKFDIVYYLNSNCVRDTEENSSKYSGYSKNDPQTTVIWMHRIKEYTWSTEKNLSGWTYTGISEER